MNNQTFLLDFSLSTLAISLLTSSAVLAQTKLSNQSKLSIYGIDSVRVGMTVAEASKAAGVKLVRPSGYEPNASCFYVQPQSKPKGIGFMVTDGRVARVDVWKNQFVTTISGAKIGDTEARIKSLYPRKIQVSPHKYVPEGHYLTFVPKDAKDKNYAVVFETDGKKVTQFRSGKRPEVEYVEGCS